MCDLPKVVRITSVTDAGEFGAAQCPHCGADGRYIVNFDCEDGTSRAAMRGCFSKFKKHSFVKVYEKITDKRADYEKRGWKLSSWDVSILDAIDGFVYGRITEKDAQAIIDNMQARSKAYKKTYGREKFER